MGGIELRNGTLVVRREPNRLDELAIRFSEILDQFHIEHVYIQITSRYSLVGLALPKMWMSSSNESTRRLLTN